MSDFSSPALAQVETLLHSTWSDCNVFYRASQGSWYNWRDQVVIGNLTTPFGVFAIHSETPVDNFGVTNKTYMITMDLYYVRLAGLTAAELSGGKKKVEDIIVPKLAALRDALITNQTSFQVVSDPVIDYSMTNPANEYFAINGDNFWSGLLSVQILVGETYI